jgi:hypothetical protein
VVIAGGLWANVLIWSLAQRAHATTPEGDGGFAIAGVQDAGGDPLVWRLERSTGKLQLCKLAKAQKPKVRTLSKEEEEARSKEEEEARQAAKNPHPAYFDDVPPTVALEDLDFYSVKCVGSA